MNQLKLQFYAVIRLRSLSGFRVSPHLLCYPQNFIKFTFFLTLYIYFFVRTQELLKINKCIELKSGVILFNIIFPSICFSDLSGL